MPRESLDEGLQNLETELILASGLVETAIVKSLNALTERDTKLAERIIAEDDVLDARTSALEEMCVDLIRREAPIAGDLRWIISILQIANELERIGDYAEGIAKIVVRMKGQKLLKDLEDIPKMVATTLEMLKVSLYIHTSKDSEIAKNKFNEVYNNDDVVDKLYEKVVLDLMEYMRRKDDAIERATYLLWVAHNVERMADRAVNIAEKAYYEAVGEMPNN